MIEQIDLFPDKLDDLIEQDKIDSFDDQVVCAVAKMTYPEKRSSLVFGMADHEYDYIRILVRLAEHASLLRANIHKTDMTSKEFHILEEVLQEVCDFSHMTNNIWESYAIRNYIGVPVT